MEGRGWGASHVVRLVMGITPLRGGVAPPFTSKIVKFVLERMGLFADLRGVRRAYKALSISPLYLDGRPLYKLAEDRRVLTLSEGTTYHAYVSALVGADRLDEVLVLDARRLETPYGDLLVEPVEVSIAELRSLSLAFRDTFRLRLLTPLVLSNKTMMPPSFPAKKRIPSMHKLLPSPGYIFSHLARLWNRNVDPRLAVPKPGGDEWAAYKIGRVADLTLVEVNYSLRPVTVLYDRRDGRFREVRGTVGWIHYKLLHPKPRPIFAKLLALANYMGVGRSRGIGMGQVRVEPLD